MPARSRTDLDRRARRHLPPPRERGIGYVPQDGALFPAMSVADQLAFAGRLRRRSKQEIQTQVDQLAEAMSITHLLHRLPAKLSGGERQRVALARALSANPSFLILDEPFSALDEHMKDSMMELVRKTKQDFDLTVLHVTHSRREAKALGTHFLSIAQGKITSSPPRS